MLLIFSVVLYYTYKTQTLSIQGYFQALFYYRYTVVILNLQLNFETQSCFHNEFFHATYESTCSKCEFPEICVLDSVCK